MILAGIAVILLAPETGSLLDDREVDSGSVVAVLIFLTGALYGAVAYWIGGGAALPGLRGAGGDGTLPAARHILAFAAGPIVLALLLVWPLRLAIYGSDSSARAVTTRRRAPGSSSCSRSRSSLWSLGLMVYGISVVDAGGRSLGALGLPLSPSSRSGSSSLTVALADSAVEPLRNSPQSSSSGIA